MEYSFFLYKEAFNKLKFKAETRSLCGCYIIPLKFDTNVFIKLASYRYMTLKNNQNISNVLSWIVGHILLRVTEGDDVFEPFE